MSEAATGMKARVPKLRFPEFRDEAPWSTIAIEQLCDSLDSDRKPVTKIDRRTGEYPYYGASGIVDYIDSYIFDEELVLVGEDGAKWGSYEPTAFVARGRYWVNNHAHVLRPTGIVANLLADYLSKTDLSPYVTGAAPPKLTGGKLSRIPIPVASRAEQRKIADCLSSLDDLITAHADKLAALKQHKQGLLEQLFPREGETVPRLRFPAFRGSAEWRIVTLSTYIDECDLKSSRQDEHEVLTSSRSGLIRQTDYYGGNGNRLTERDNVGFNVIPPQYLTYRSRSDDGSFFFNENTLGITGIVSVYYPVFRLRGMNHRFFLALTRKNRSQIGSYSIGTSQKVLSMSQLRSLRLRVPALGEQREIGLVLASLDTLIIAQSDRLAALKQHKQGMLQQLFPAMDEATA